MPCGTTNTEICPSARPELGDSWSDEEGTVDASWENDGALVREAYTLREDDDDWGQAHTLVREVMDDDQRLELIDTVAGALETVIEPVLSNAIQYWKNIDEEVGQRIEEKVRAGAPQGEQQPGGDPLDLKKRHTFTS